MQAVREGGGMKSDEAKNGDRLDPGGSERSKRNEKSSWQMELSMISYKSCFERERLKQTPQKSLKKNEKSSWQTVSDVIKFKSCRKSDDHRESQKSKNFEKSSWQMTKAVIE